MTSKPKQRIAIIAEWYLPRLGGTEIYLHDLASKLKATGVEVEIITPMPGPSEIDGVRVFRLCDEQKYNGGYFFPPSMSASNGADLPYYLELLFRPRRPSPLQRLRKLLSSGKYDVAHVHLGNTPFAYAATNACLKVGLPTVATFHSVLGPAEIPIARVLSAFMKCSTWAGRVYLTAVSGRVVDVRAPMLGSAPFEILPHGIEPSWGEAIRHERAQRAPLPSPFQIELVSPIRLHARKRPHALLSAMQALKPQLPAGTNVRLRIAGDGPLRNALQQEIIKKDLTDCVELCGKLSRQEVATLLTEADLILLPTHLESFGIAALEARIAGVPVAIMSDSAATDFLTSNVDCLMADDDAEFAELLVKYVGNDTFRNQLKHGAMKPLEGYCQAALTKRCLAIYRKAMG